MERICSKVCAVNLLAVLARSGLALRTLLLEATVTLALVLLQDSRQLAVELSARNGYPCLSSVNAATAGVRKAGMLPLQGVRV